MYKRQVRIELAKLILVGTRITYQATGDAGIHVRCKSSSENKWCKPYPSDSYTAVCGGYPE